MVAVCSAKGCNSRSGTEEVLGLTVLGVVAGLALAAGYYYVFMRLQNWVVTGPQLRLLAMASFIIRLVLILVIFFVAGYLTPRKFFLPFIAAFIVLFTILLLVWVYVMATKRPGGPPPDDGSEAN